VIARGPVADGKVANRAGDRLILRTDGGWPWFDGPHPAVLLHTRHGKGVEDSPARRLAPVLQGLADLSPMTQRIVARSRSALHGHATA
jgi:hypothetical protein